MPRDAAAARDMRAARAAQPGHYRISETTLDSRLSANSVDGEYWGNHDLEWAKGSLTADHERSQRESSSERADSKKGQLRESSQSFFQAQKFQRNQERLLHDPKVEIRDMEGLHLQMKTPLFMLPRRRRKESDSRKHVERVGSGRESKHACFGYISWRSVDDSSASSSTNLARYACFKDDTDPSEVFKLLECWKLKPPSVLMSVTGSAQELNLPDKIQTDFKKGFAHAASCTDAWVITGGTDTGVMKMVGQALSKEQASTRALKDGEVPPPVIGVVPFGSVMRRDLLYSEEVRQAIIDLEDASARIDRREQSRLISEKTVLQSHSVQADLLPVFNQAEAKHQAAVDDEDQETDEQQVESALDELRIAYRRSGKNSRYEAGLDRGHTHFLLVDDGSKGRYEDPINPKQAWYSEIELRTSLEKKICEHYKVPGVQVVLQGSYGTLKTIKSAIDQERQVVLIKDSGGAAHVLAAIIEPLLERAKELPSEHAEFRRKEVYKRIEDYWNEAKDSPELKQMLRSAPHKGDSSRREEEMRQEVEDICVNFEKITTFSFLNHVAKTAGRKPVQGRPFDQVLLDAIVQACKLEKEHEERVADTRRSPLGPMRPSEPPIHEKCRAQNPFYPRRIPVPDDKVKWTEEWAEYKPKSYCDDLVKQHSRSIDDDFDKDHWADPPSHMLPQLREQLENRLTFCETPHFEESVKKTLKDATKIKFDKTTDAPRNPRGRTGLAGRGLCGRWGPNHAADPIITRFSPHDGKLQFIAIQRNEMDAWAIPGGIVVTPGREDVPRKVVELLKRVPQPGSEASTLNERSSTEDTPEGNAEERKEVVEKLLAQGTTVYCGYVDDPRNTVRSRAAAAAFQRVPTCCTFNRLVASSHLTPLSSSCASVRPRTTHGSKRSQSITTATIIRPASSITCTQKERTASARRSGWTWIRITNLAMLTYTRAIAKWLIGSLA